LQALRSIDNLRYTLEIQNRKLNTQLSTLSKERNDACNNLNRRIAKFRVFETQLAEQRDLSEQAMDDRNNTQSKFVAEHKINTLSTTLDYN